MLKIATYNGLRIKNLPLDSSVSSIEEGQIAELTLLPNTKVACIVSKGWAPCGIITDVDKKNNYVGVIDMSFEGETDQYETSFIYAVGMPLYCSHNGKFQPVQTHPGCFVLGKVLDPPTAGNGMLRFQFDAIAAQQPGASLPSPQQIQTISKIAASNEFKQVDPSEVLSGTLIGTYPKKGIHCSGCNFFNEFMNEGNQSDGTYKCYQCRS